MTRSILVIFIILLTLSCNKEDDNIFNGYLLSEVVGYDYNCSTCILSFPDDLKVIEEEFGPSEGNFYNTINLHISDSLPINQKVFVKVRKPQKDEIRACITLFPTVTITCVYVIDYKIVK